MYFILFPAEQSAVDDASLQVIESTGVVVTPYMEYPQLLGMLLQMLSEGSPQARLEVLKVRSGHSWGTVGMQLRYSLVQVRYS